MKIMKRSDITFKAILCGLVILFFGRIQAQSSLSLGVGLSSSIYLLDIGNPYPAPGLPLSPHAILKVKRHEILAGPDLYLHKNSPVIIGAQAGYRYHLRKERRTFDPFVEANFQFARFRTGNGLFPERYNSTTHFRVNDGALLGHQSFVNTYGIGLNLNVADRLMLYSVFGGGYNYHQQTVIRNHSWNSMRDENFISFIGYIRLGASFFFYRKK